MLNNILVLRPYFVLLFFSLTCVLLFTQCGEDGDDPPKTFNLLVVNTTPYDLEIFVQEDINLLPIAVELAEGIMSTKLEVELFYHTGYFLTAFDDDGIEKASLFFFHTDETEETYEWIIYP